MRSIAFPTLLAGALALATPSITAAQAWGGTGDAGTDPYGQGWRLDDALGPLVWSIPGFGDGGRPWEGPVPLHSFTIALVGGTPIVANHDPFDFFATRLMNSDRDVAWDVVLSPDRRAARFAAPPGGEIVPGEIFFVNLVFEGGERPTAFTAHYGVTAAPEPGSYALLATGLAGLVAVRARRGRITGTWRTSR